MYTLLKCHDHFQNTCKIPIWKIGAGVVNFRSFDTRSRSVSVLLDLELLLSIDSRELFQLTARRVSGIWHDNSMDNGLCIDHYVVSNVICHSIAWLSWLWNNLVVTTKKHWMELYQSLRSTARATFLNIVYLCTKALFRCFRSPKGCIEMCFTCYYLFTRFYLLWLLPFLTTAFAIETQVYPSMRVYALDIVFSMYY